MNRYRRLFLMGCTTVLIGLSGCSNQGSTNGTAASGGGTPQQLVMGFVPSEQADKLADTAKPMADFVSKELNIPIKTFTATTYAGLVEAMGSGKVDIGALAPLAYVLAHDQNGAKVLLKSSRHNAVTYHSMFVARADSGIKSIDQAKGKKMAFVDPASASGYLFPAAYLKGKGYDPDKFFSQTIFSGGHDKSVISVYNGDVNVAAVYDDARDQVAKQDTYKDVKTKVVKIGQTQEIPNDTISVRKDLDSALADKIKAAFLKYAKSADGKKTLMDLYGIDGMAEAKDSDYDIVRQTAKTMGVELNSLK
ncbi:MAG: phosphate/phosphite/phosphonate ABC transporter substrate-binding protein [Abitibacteriaceae bacterium]|nr:phosphate/phosphite/phosphonate ABC transporter substrate-binding protein [Abditibacteriaceae bacterium]